MTVSIHKDMTLSRDMTLSIPVLIYLFILQQIFYFPPYSVLSTLLGGVNIMISQNVGAYCFHGFSIYWEENH